MKRFKLFNNISGWVAFLIAAVTYLLTIEPTASFWDCGEFISSAYKLEVGHPPGAPFFMMTARLFTLFAPDTTMVAMLVNAMSAILSALTILFLYWTITHLLRRLITANGQELSVGNTIAILGAGMVGALAYTFSDTFWFSAVEGEVYAYSSFFTAIVFWCILKWEDVADQEGNERWLVLIAYLMGLSIGVHLLNLLCIPAIVLVYYFRKYPFSFKGLIIAFGVSVVILAAILYGMIPGFVKVGSWFELFCVNVLSMPFNSGFAIYLILTACVLVASIWISIKSKSEWLVRIFFLLALTIVGIPFFGSGVWIGIFVIIGICAILYFVKNINRRWINVILLCIMVMFVGYTSYGMIVIRSMANTPMDQNSPEDLFSLQSYLNREQYGDRPLFYGPVYSAPEELKVVGNQCIPVEKKGGKIWSRAIKSNENEKDKYIVTGTKMVGYETDSRFNMLFPRLYSPSHANQYKQYVDIKGQRIPVDRCGNREVLVKPTMGENLGYLFSYQINFMYWRYFMWNFVGRQNDWQGHGELDKGNWISGISVIDNARLGDQSLLPESYKENKGHNRYYFLPLILGLLGIVWQLMQKRKGAEHFFLVFVLFFMTGLAIVLYLNQTPYQPRERDYAYAGSFYAFAIWIGIGVMFIYDMLSRVIAKGPSAIVASVLCLGVPALMAAENWDDHDRSGRYTARDVGANYLNSTLPNAIIFSNGDNDTFPLWYNQEVEGERTDVRVSNLSYLSTDWYIDQMKREAYESQPLPISWDAKDYRSGNLDVARVGDHPHFGGKMPLSLALELIRNPEFIDENGIGNVFATTLTLPIDKAQVLATGTVSEKDSNLIVSEMVIPMRRSLLKSQMMFLEMLNTNNWERPMYVALTVGDEFYPQIRPYLQLEGLAYRIVPIKGDGNRVNTEVMYDNMMNKFKYGNLADSTVYIDEQNMRMVRTMRMAFAQLVAALIDEGQNEKAKEVLDYSFEVLPGKNIRYDYAATMLAGNYYELGFIEEGDAIMDVVGTDCVERIEWVLSLPKRKQANVSQDMSLRQNVGLIQNIYIEASQAKSPLAEKYLDLLQKYYPLIK